MKNIHYLLLLENPLLMYQRPSTTRRSHLSRLDDAVCCISLASFKAVRREDFCVIFDNTTKEKVIKRKGG